jgi:RND family efflux transporter MFP subunit
MSSTDVDVRQLEIVRDKPAADLASRRRNIVSRYLVPSALLAGFLLLVAWASRDVFVSPQDVWVVPVLASQSGLAREGSTLFQAAGWIEPRPTPIRVAALAPGAVEKLLVVQDQQVKAGDAIAELVKADAQLAHDRAAANVKLLEAELKESEAALVAAMTRFEHPVHLEAEFSEAEGLLAQVQTERGNLPFAMRRAEAELTFAEIDYDRKQSAAAAVAGREINRAKSVLDSARATVDELKNRSVTLAKQEKALVGRRNALREKLKLLADERRAKDEAQAKVEAARARLAQGLIEQKEAKLRLDRMTIRAPVDGRIYQLLAFPGTTLTGGMGAVPNVDGSTVVTMYQPANLQVRVDARFEDIPKVSLGQSVRIGNPALAEPIAGTVLFISSEANIQKNTLQVKVALDHADEVLKPEMLVEVSFLSPKRGMETAGSEAETRFYVPKEVLLQDEGQSFVWIADQSDEVARKVAVTIGRSSSGGLVEVSGDGLNVASRVIVRGNENLRDGQSIRIVAERDDEQHVHPDTQPHTMQRLPAEGK